MSEPSPSAPPVHAPPASLRAPPAARPIDQDPALRMLLPIGRSILSIAAGYVALFSVLLVPAPIALLLGILAVMQLKRRPDLSGMGRAVFAIVMGSIFSVVLIALVIASALGSS